MEVKTFGGKKITIRFLSKNEPGLAKKFQDLINSLIREDAPLLINREVTSKGEKKWLRDELKLIKEKRQVFIIAESNNEIVGSSVITLKKGRSEHVGEFGIMVKKEWRNLGLGSFLIDKVIKLAKKELKPKPKIIRLGAIPTNKSAIDLYKRFGFQTVARIPKQLQYKDKLVDEIVMLKYM